ncbi:MAG: hypothetical protein CVV21_01925 [Candidatus Goldiibacteriota bacterium HGW-Goldbacteria-1]|jgi:hypothetical protein|nr:MAG: hypothetical protein CVV21_01925 [Candidatus Goldiibacteriota bacterium HGW-Goldbacteria-1]
MEAWRVRGLEAWMLGRSDVWMLGRFDAWKIGVVDAGLQPAVVALAFGIIFPNLPNSRAIFSCRLLFY